MAPLCNVFRWQHRAVWHRAVWFDVSGITSLHFVSLGCFVSLCNPVVPVYPVWAYYAHGQQRRCQEDPVSLPSGRLETTTRSSPHHVAQHHPTGSETPPYAPQSSRFGSEPPSVEDDVDVWRYAIVSCMPETTTMIKWPK